MGVAENLAQVQRRVALAAAQAGRDPAGVTLLAVSKTMPRESIEEAYRAGQRLFAENRVQEWLDKEPQLPPDCEWHLIGRVQTNKVKYLTERITLIHSLDRMGLLQALEHHGGKAGYMARVLVQVNVARDPAKAGLLPEETADFLDLIPDHPHVQVLGFMTIGALGASLAETRVFFRELRLLAEKMQTRVRPGVVLKELSMGMSQDFEIAVEEGATMVRIGREIFGQRR
ncbi:hypothetical protein CEB3_c33240 [Peptococcaceae bacterium CEB3]|nr:hypothetical protein CEB3_c33240 [Peptococcaceae bacterium CEB3]